MNKFSTALFLFAAHANAISRTMTDCLAVANLFDNTCATTVTSSTSPITD